MLFCFHSLCSHSPLFELLRNHVKIASVQLHRIMATATLASSGIDLRSKDTFPIRLGASISKPKEAKKLTSVRYNHVPELSRPSDIQTSIKSSKDGSQEQLLLKDGSDEYKYAGKSLSFEQRYILLCKKSGKDKEFVLERLNGHHEFNLVKTSTESDAAKLAAKFPQLSFQEDDEDDIFGDREDEEEPVDPKNPWDYRNYLKASTSRPKEPQAPARANGTSTPPVQSRAASSTPVSRPVKRTDGPLVAQKKRRAADTSKANTKRVKAGTEPPPESTPAKSKPTADLPGFRVEHKRVAQRKTSLDNSGELILELATPVTEKPPKASAMALALSGQLGHGPISLHSAASSPASRIASPNPPRPEGMEEGEEFDLGASSSPEAVIKSPPRQRGGDYFGEDDADADIEDFELPSPAQTHHPRRKSVGAATATGGDDDDDLEAQMMAALDEDDDAPVVPAPRPTESDEESEEE